MPQLSVVIITFNEEKNIGRCLESVQDVADEIIVVDSYSTDKTEDLCKHFNVNFIQYQWEGYSVTKNFANTQAKNDWILSLDADEALSPALKKSILEIKKGNEFQTYSFNRLNNYCGFWIKHCGWYPDVKIRIFDRKVTNWVGSIHEELLIQSNKPIIHLKGDLLHYSYYSIEQHFQQTEKFSTLSANALFLNGGKVNWIKLYVSPVVKFLQSYFLKLGILDGYYGFIVCKISAYYIYLKYFKLKQLYNK